MGPQVIVQQGGMTFGQFVWVWLGGMGFFGVVFIIGGWTFSRNPKAGRTQVRQALANLLNSGVLWEAEVNQALNAPHLPPAPEEMSGPMWLERVLAGAPEIEQLIRFWKRPFWVDASLYAGLGLFLACGVCAVVFLVFPTDPQSSASVGFMFALLMSLPLMGMLIGLSVGFFRGFFKGNQSLEQRASGQERLPREMARYHSRLLLWGGIILFCIPFFLTMSALFFSPKQPLVVGIVGLGILPLLTLAALLFDEHVIRRLAFLPSVQMGADPALSERIDTMYFFPRLLAVFRWLEYGMLAAMAAGQVFLTLSSLNQGEDEVYGPIVVGLLAFYGGVAALLGLRGSELRWGSGEQSPQEDTSSGEERAAPPTTP